MDKDEIIRMAYEAGAVKGEHTVLNHTWFELTAEQLERFAALVAAHVAEVLTKSHEESFKAYVYQAKADRELEALRAQLEEREACAKVCEEVDNNMEASWKRNAVNCAAAIRARGEK